MSRRGVQRPSLLERSWWLPFLRALILLCVVTLTVTSVASAQGATAGQEPISRTAAERAAARAAARASTSAEVRGLGDSAVVDERVVRIRIPRPATTEEPGIPSMVGYYVWTLTMNGSDPFTMALMADTAMQTTELKAILEASTLRQCPAAMPRGVRDCTTPIGVRIRFDDQSIELTVRDEELITRLRRSRPLSYTRSTIEPNGRVQSVEKGWVYLDRNP